MPTASTSAWTWVPERQLYYSHTTQQWAQAMPDGTWRYSEPVHGGNGSDTTRDSSAGRQLTSYADIDEGRAPEWMLSHRAEADHDEGELGGNSGGGAFADVGVCRLIIHASGQHALANTEERIALCNPGEPLVIGRDKSYERRLRLKDMSVSKSHATVFWDEVEQQWSVVDNGSTHGTYIRRADSQDKRRLADPKIASQPHRLKHQDTLIIGAIKFAVHVHASFACDECASRSDESNLITLVSLSDTPKTDEPAFTLRTKEDKEQERRNRMQGLKDKYLASPAKSASATKGAFVDRARQRRTREGPTASVPGSQPSKLEAAISGTNSTSSSRAATPPVAVDPFEAESKGALLLSKMGQSSGLTGGDAGGKGLGTLVQAKTFVGVERDARPGLGSRALVDAHDPNQQPTSGSDSRRGWRDDVREASRKRFKEMGSEPP